MAVAESLTNLVFAPISCLEVYIIHILCIDVKYEIIFFMIIGC